MSDADDGRLGPEVGAAALRALRGLLHAAHEAQVDDLPGLVHDAAVTMGATAATVYVVDYDLVELVPLGRHAHSGRGSLPIAGTLGGRAFAESVVLVAGDGPVTSWVPLCNGIERVGVLEVTASSSSLPEDVLALLSDLVAQLLVTRSSVGDMVETTRRRGPMALEAEMQWKLLPPLSFATPAVSISGLLVPANEVAGDSFDYAMNGDVLHVALIDAMGHGLSASLLASLILSAYRNGRRSGLELTHVVRSIDKFVSARFDGAFATAVVAELDVRTGVYRWVNCGHLPVLLVRDGRVVKTFEEPVNMPLGLQGSGELDVGEERLERDDRVLMYSDGVVEARDVHGEWFGTDRLVDQVMKVSSAGLPAAETMRRLVHGILAHQAGDLQDDATAVLIEWRERTSSAGAAAPSA